ncbi:MAG: hypothetical protein IPL63_06830 [Saprospiraceae bacterium]|nr:hypothetical protein [Saprospiraceae bacterium]MBK6564539.1 hypothetical protein [Saprospiraceae bacterium]MBK7523176.1 hypothetical protein [Saprospiraceae bacterium]MBK8371830.1 hypothetical protein [Saprospiraceae bacterium]MBK8547095.1 hypothetical protein [Saprospiraceae bacterium]
MRVLQHIKIVWVVLVVLFGCTKEESIENLEGKIIYSYPGRGITQLFYIKDLKTKNIQTFNSFPYVSPSGDLVARNISATSYSGIFVTDFLGEEKLFEYNSFSFPVTNVLWSPDNNKLAMLSPDKNNIKIYDFTLEIVTDIFLPEKDIWKKLIGWSDMDGFIYFTSQNVKKQIYIGKIRPDGSGYQDVYRPDEDHLLGYDFDMHNESGTIVFSLFETPNSLVELCKINTDGSGFKSLFNSSGFGAWSVAGINISPDGKKIAYEYLFERILITNIDGTPFGFELSPAYKPYWSKDGTAIMSSFRYYIDWNSSKSDIRIKYLELPKSDENIVEKGPISFHSWYFD